VFLPSVNPFQLRALPRYNKMKLGAKAEHDIRTVFGMQGFGHSATAPNYPNDVDEQFYNNDQFNEQNMMRRRQGQLPGKRHERDQYHDDIIRRRETELNAASSDIDDPYQKGYLDGRREREETDEEYYRRTGKHRRL
jgi:hypothetical protein